MKRKFLVFLLIIVFGTGQAMVFAESGVQEAEQAEDRKPEANIGNTEDTELTTEESEAEIDTEKKELPFHEKTDIRVGKFCSKVYFGPFRDVNGNEDATKEQVGANHVISKSGGKPLTEELLHYLTKVTGKQEDGTNFPPEQLTLADLSELKAINAAKTKGDTGVFDLTFSLSDGKKAAVKVTLTGDHRVSFDPDGGDYQPETQTVKGGDCAESPRDPEKEGYLFEGWYYIDEDG